MTISDIKEKYVEKAIKFGGQFLLPPNEACRYLSDCVENGFILEGVEGFFITDNGAYQPSQENSNDFADVKCSNKEFVENTKLLISERSEMKILFDVIFSE